MKSLHGLAVILCTGLLMTSTTASAQDSAPPAAFDDEVLNLLLESRNQRPASQATAEERAAAIDELTSIYVISSLPRAIELAESPRIRAQIDLQRRALLFSSYANEFLANNQPTEQEIFDTYQEQIVLAPTKEFKARHIVVETQGEALKLIEQLDGGADFVKLATENSTGPSATSGGDLGWFSPQSMVKPFSDAVAAMDDGDFTKTPVQTQFGWHVILREGTRDSAPPPLESVTDVIKQQLGQQKFLDFIADLRAKTAE